MACTPAVSAPSALAPSPAGTGTRLGSSTAARRGALALRPARALPALRLGLGGRRGAVVVRATAAEVRAGYGRPPALTEPRARVLTGGNRCSSAGGRGAAGQGDQQVLLRRGGRRGARGTHRHRALRGGRPRDSGKLPRPLHWCVRCESSSHQYWLLLV